MKQKLIDASIASGRLKLSPYHLFSHYYIVPLFLLPPITFGSLTLWDYLHSETIFKKIDYTIIYIVPISLSLLCFWLQYIRLKLTVIKTSFPADEMLKILRKAIKNLGWHASINNKKVIIVKMDDDWAMRNSGFQVTILICNNLVYLNSINDPDRRSSPIWLGNKKNIKDLVTEINRLSDQEEI